MFPKTFSVNDKDIIIETGNLYRVYSTITDFKKGKLIFINRTDVFYGKTSLKIKNAITKKFEIKEKDIFEIKSNLEENKNKGKVKIEKINFDLFLYNFFKNSLNQQVITRLTNIKGIPANITGIVSVNMGITMIFFTDISLSLNILKSLIDETNLFNKFYLKDNYPFLNSVTFISKKFNEKRLKINSSKDICLKHFKDSLNFVLQDLLEVVLKNNLKNQKIIKIEIGLNSKDKSLKFLNEIIKLDHIKSNLINLDSIQNYYLLQKSLFDLFGKDLNIQNLFFEINGISVFNDSDQRSNIKEILKKFKLILKTDEILTLKIFDAKIKNNKFYSKYTRQ